MIENVHVWTPTLSSPIEKGVTAGVTPASMSALARLLVVQLKALSYPVSTLDVRCCIFSLTLPLNDQSQHSVTTTEAVAAVVAKLASASCQPVSIYLNGQHLLGNDESAPAMLRKDTERSFRRGLYQSSHFVTLA